MSSSSFEKRTSSNPEGLVDLNQANYSFVEQVQVQDSFNDEEFLRQVISSQNKSTFMLAVQFLNRRKRIQSQNPSFKFPTCSMCLLEIGDLNLWFPSSSSSSCSQEHFICESCLSNLANHHHWLQKCCVCQESMKQYQRNEAYVHGMRRILDENVLYDCTACQKKNISFSDVLMHANSTCKNRCNQECGLLLFSSDVKTHRCFACTQCKEDFKTFEGLKKHYQQDQTCLVPNDCSSSSSSSSSTDSDQKMNEFSDGFDCILTSSQESQFIDLIDSVKRLFCFSSKPQTQLLPILVEVLNEICVSTSSSHSICADSFSKCRIDWFQYIVHETDEYIDGFQYRFDLLLAKISCFFQNMQDLSILSEFIYRLNAMTLE